MLSYTSFYLHLALALRSCKGCVRYSDDRLTLLSSSLLQGEAK
jgi:hypothetical protein